MSLKPSTPFKNIVDPSQGEINNVARFLNDFVQLVDGPNGREVKVTVLINEVPHTNTYMLPDFFKDGANLANMPYTEFEDAIYSSDYLWGIISDLEGVISCGVLYSSKLLPSTTGPYSRLLSLYASILAYIELYRSNPQNMKELARIGLFSVFALFGYTYKEENFSDAELKAISNQLEKLGIDLEHLTFKKLLRIYDNLGLNIPEEYIRQIFELQEKPYEDMDIDERRKYWANHVLKKYPNLEGVSYRFLVVHADLSDGSDDNTARVVYTLRPLRRTKFGSGFGESSNKVLTKVPTSLNDFMKYFILNYGRNPNAFKNKGLLTELMSKAIGANIECKRRNCRVVMFGFDEKGNVIEIPVFGSKGGLTSILEPYRKYLDARRSRKKKKNAATFSKNDKDALYSFIHNIYQATVEGRILIIK